MADDVLSGQRVLLRPPRLADAEALFTGVTSDPRVTKYLRFAPHTDVETTRRAITQQLNVDGDHTWAIVVGDDDEAVGTFSHRPRPLPHAMEIGYCLAVKCWGRGVISEAIRLVLNHLHNDSGVYRVWATCHVDNIGSAKALQRAGLRFEGRLVRHTVFPNLAAEPLDSLLYARALR